MGKPGQRGSHPSIIDKPELKSSLWHWAEIGATMLLWMLWLYCILPVFAAVVSLLNPATYKAIFSSTGLGAMTGVVYSSGCALLSIFLVEVGWIGYNYIRHRIKKPEEKTVAAVTPAHSIEEFFSVTPEDVQKTGDYRRVEVLLEGNEMTITALRKSPLKKPARSARKKRSDARKAQAVI